MLQAAISCLDSYSPEEDNLSKEPLFSYFTTAYGQCTKFVKQLTKLDIIGSEEFGQTIDIPFTKHDLIGRVYLVFFLPALRHKKEKIRKDTEDNIYNYDESDSDSETESSVSRHKKDKKRRRHRSSSSSSCDDYFDEDMPKHDFVYWNNHTGHVLTETLELWVGNVPLVTHQGEYLDIQDEFTTKSGCSTDEDIGRHRKESDLWKASRRNQQLVVRARFHFCDTVAKALQTFNIRQSRVFGKLRIRPLDQCWYSSDGSTPYLMYRDAELSTRDIHVEVYANVYHLTKAERVQIYGEEHVHLMHQVQYMEYDICNKSSIVQTEHRVPLEFKHPVTELTWVLQSYNHYKRKQWFNYSGLNNSDPLHAYKLSFSNKDFTPKLSGRWYRTIDPSEGHTNIPKRHIYNQLFSLYPEDDSFHSGYINLTAIDDVKMHLWLQRGLGPYVKLKVWAKTINLFRILPNGRVGVGWLIQKS